MSLMPDFAQVCTKAPDDFAALYAMRKQQRAEAEAKRLEAEREKIRREEEAKARAEAVGGASMRDYFAAKAMQGLVSGHFAKYGHEDYWPRPEIACEAYEIADAMLAARKPEYDPTRMAPQALDDRATIAGLESAVSHLSALFDEFRALLVEVNDVCGRDGLGGQLEDGESEIIDKVRAALSMTEASAMLAARKGKS